MLTLIPLLRCAVFALLPVLVGACSTHRPAVASGSNPSPEQKKTVRIITERDGDRTRFFVENTEFCEVTVTFELSSSNLNSSVKLPRTATFPARQTTEAFTVEPIEAGKPWQYSYTSHYKLGSHLARHDDSCVYHLPYSPGREYTVTQAYNGGYSHKGANKYAIDWKMPEGTPVLAARSGMVVKIRSDSNLGGPSIDFDKHNNYVLIRHDDGTLAHYCHLQKHGNLVNVGDYVVAGQPIARSGNTGFSSGPHLHFCVFKTISGKQRASLPVKFQTEDGRATLIAHRRYTAPDIRGIASIHGTSALFRSQPASQGAAGE